MMNFIRKEDGSISPVKMILMIAVVSVSFKIGGMVIGNLLEKSHNPLY